MADDLSFLEEKRNKLVKARADAERKRALKQEIFKLEHPVQAKVGSAVLNMFKPRAQDISAKARKNKLKKKVATVGDIDKALSGLMKM